MPNKLFVMPYNMGSESAKKIADALGIKRVNKNNTKLRGGPDKILINWGNSVLEHPELLKCRVYNRPGSVRTATNKLRFFAALKDEDEEGDLPFVTPDWTNSRNTAAMWVREGKLVVVRYKLNAHSGDGIELVDRDTVFEKHNNVMPAAPLYTLYVPKKDEYRLHFVRGQGTVFKQRKALIRGTESPNFKIRNLAGGFIYANQDVQTPEVVDKVAELFYNDYNSLGLDFGCLDIIYNEKDNKAYILECNTAPGLAGKTLDLYTETFRKLL